MKAIVTGAVVLAFAIVASTPARAADDSRVKAATRQVETGAKELGDGKIADGTKDTAQGIGKTVAEGAKYTGNRLRDSGKAAEPQAKSAWRNVKDGAVAFGHSVKNFFTTMFH